MDRLEDALKSAEITYDDTPKAPNKKGGNIPPRKTKFYFRIRIA
jgi:hypothetical protein